MIRIRIGQGWASDPEVRAGLRAGSPEPRRAAIRAIVDVVAVEVEGVDIAAGRTEGPVAEGVLGMLRAIDRLAAGEEHASVPFEDGAVELLLHRRGGVALLSVATLSRPARLLAHDVEVDLPRLAEAAREAATAFCARVAEIAPSARALPELRSLLRAATRTPPLASPGPVAVPATRALRTHRRRRDAACSFEIHDEAGRLSTWRGPGADLDSLLVRGRVSFRTPAGDEFLSVAGAPYLTFRDLCAAAARLAASPAAPVAFDLARPGRNATSRVTVADGAVSVAGAVAVRCDSLELAQAILEGVADFCAVVRRRAPGQAGNTMLSDLEASAAVTLAHVLEAREGDRLFASRRRVRTGREERPSRRPLGPGSLRRISFRSIASTDVGPPAGEGLLLRGDVLVACGRERTLALDAAARHHPLERARRLPVRGRRPRRRAPARGRHRGARHRERVGDLDPAGAPRGRCPQRPLPPARRAPVRRHGPLRLDIRRVAGRRTLDLRVPRGGASLPPPARTPPRRGVRHRDGPRPRSRPARWPGACAGPGRSPLR